MSLYSEAHLILMHVGLTVRGLLVVILFTLSIVMILSSVQPKSSVVIHYLQDLSLHCVLPTKSSASGSALVGTSFSLRQGETKILPEARAMPAHPHDPGLS